MGFDGRRVLALESRRAKEMAVLIEKNGGQPILAPSMREVPIADNPEVFTFYDDLRAGKYDMVILLTGVGTRAVSAVLDTRFPPNAFAGELRKLCVVPRGPKPSAVLREWNVPWAVTVPAPNTWRELLCAIEDRPERHVAVQEYGRSNSDLLAGLQQQGRTVTTVKVYQWDLPLDTQPLRAAAHQLAAGQVDVLLLTTSMQIVHLLQIAEEEGILPQTRERLGQLFIGSIGPTTSEGLEDLGLKPTMEPSTAKMGVLVKEASDMISPMRGTNSNG